MQTSTIYRSHTCNELRLEHLNQEVRLAGWVNHVRDLGSMVFLTLRDHYGLTQVSFPPETSAELLAQAQRLKPESVIFVRGLVQDRGKDRNPNMPTGAIEVVCTELKIDSLVEELPFPLNDIMPPEDLRLKYRFVDLRRPRLQENLKLRFKLMQALRNFLASKGFLEIQTPILTASSPEGARDFVVPSRLNPGRFYALPQAPQQYKQLLMCSGIDRYFQIAPCFRDEDARADRSPGEFYQLDMEMAFVGQDEIFQLLEELYAEVVPQVSNKRIAQFPFPRIPYQTSMERYGNDKPDLRFDMPLIELTAFFKTSSFSAFAQAESVKAMVLKGCADKSNKFFKDCEAKAKNLGASGLAYLNFRADEIKGPIAKFFDAESLEQLRQSAGAEIGDSLLLCAGPKASTLSLMGKLRVEMAKELQLIDESLLAFCWIVDFPFYEWDEENEKIEFCHNPFSMPQGGLEALMGDKTNEELLQVLAYQYDIVCNGIEISSGAIRNHRPDLMYRAFELAGYSREEVEKRFGHMISAFSYGAPPHGGIAPGLDRMVMIFADEPNIREVIAFPMNQKAQDPMTGAPTSLDAKQLKELHLAIINETSNAKP